MPIAREILDMLELGLKPSQVILENGKNRKVFPLCDGFRLLLSMAIDVSHTRF